jgi:hypothetical protein
VRGRPGTGGREAPGVTLEQPDEVFGERAFLGRGETVGAHIKTLDAAPREASEKDTAFWVDLREKQFQRNTWPGLLRARSASAT